jgi:DNA modification methylase
MKIELWPIDRVIPYARNARTMTAASVDKVAASIQEFGWRQPIVVDVHGVIIAGHTRLLAARKLGLTELPVHVADSLTPAQVKAYRLMDNRSHDETSWDFELLGPELLDLQNLGFGNLALTGFDEKEIADFLAGATSPNAGLTDEDALPADQENVVTVPGDIWLLGPHRILCGDATVPADVHRLLSGTSPVLMVTDPPYGVQYDPEWRAKAGVNKNPNKLGRVPNDNRVDWREAWALFPGDVMYAWHAGKYAAIVQQSIEACGFEIRSQIIWAKDRFALSRGNYHWQHEPCWYAVRDKANWNGDRSQCTLWQIKAREDAGYGHGTQKPVECMRRPIQNNSKRGQHVYDPFLGSGTSIIAAESTGRVCFGLEIDPAYCDLVVRRWQDFTGKIGTLQADGQSFNDAGETRKAVAA